MAILTSGASAVKNSHWYTRDGEPAHRQPKAAGGDRATTITDAKRLGLLPSVTTILSILDKPQLGKWKVEQSLLSADRNPRKPDEGLDYWMQRVQDAAYQQVDDAAALGTKIHAALDAALGGEAWDKELALYVNPVLEFVAKTGIKITGREQRIVDLKEGYAGTTDVAFTFGKNGCGILDYKTKKTKPGQKVESYTEHKAQLSAYAASVWGSDRLEKCLCANIFISTTEPGRVEVVKHEETREYFEMFRSLAHVWRVLKGYDPRKGAIA